MSSHTFPEAGTNCLLTEAVAERSGQNLTACYQCRRCTAGCPVGGENGAAPDRLIRTILLEDKDAALRDPLIVKCIACYTCGTRCPNVIQTARIAETLKQMAREAGLKLPLPNITDFHDAFLASLKRRGRFHELEGMAAYQAKVASRELAGGKFRAVFNDLLGQVRLGMALLKKKRVHMGVAAIKRRSEIKALFVKARQVKKTMLQKPKEQFAKKH